MIAPTTLRVFWSDVFDKQFYRGKSHHTRRGYRQAIDHFDKHLGRETLLTDLTFETFEKFEVYLGRAVSQVTARHMATRVRTVWRAAHIAGLAGPARPLRVFEPPPPVPKFIARQMEAAELEHRVLSAGPLKGSDATLRDFIVQYKAERDLARSSRNQLDYVEASFSKHLGRPAAISDLTDANVNRWLQLLLDSPLSRETVKSKRRGLLVLWRAANDCDLIDTLPGRRIKRIKAPRPLPRAWTRDQLKALIVAASNVHGCFRHNGVPRAAFYRALVLVGYSTGLRLGDLMRLRRDDVGADGRVVLIMSKTGFMITTWLNEPALEAVAALPERGEYIFRGLLNRGVLAQQFRSILHMCGLPGSIRWLRRTGATLCEAATPGSASAFLGHRSPELAARHYVDPRQIQEMKPRPPVIDVSVTGGAP